MQIIAGFFRETTVGAILLDLHVLLPYVFSKKSHTFVTYN